MKEQKERRKRFKKEGDREEGWMDKLGRKGREENKEERGMGRDKEKGKRNRSGG